MLKFHRILVPIDFSDRSEAAVRLAVSLAEHFNADTMFLHALPPIPYAAGVGPGVSDAVAWAPDPELQQTLEARLRELLEKLAPEQPGERIVETGDPATLIARTAKERQADLIVMPTAGSGFFRRLLLGSVTTKVLNDVGCPVLTGAHVEDIDSSAPRPFRKVGCAVDLEAGGEHVLGFARDFASAYDASLVAIHVTPRFLEDGEGASAVTGLTSQVRDQAETRLKTLIQHCGAQAETAVTGGDPEEGVSRLAEEHRCDALVVGRRRDEGLFSGLRTHVYGIIRRAPCPVLSL